MFVVQFHAEAEHSVIHMSFRLGIQVFMGMFFIKDCSSHTFQSHDLLSSVEIRGSVTAGIQ